MAISTANRDFIDGLIDYYIGEAGSYRQIAEQYVPEIESVSDAAFGIIAGSVYASFLETYRNQQIQPGLDDIREFNMMLKERAASIKKAIVDPSSVGAAPSSTSPPAQDDGAGERQAGSANAGIHDGVGGAREAHSKPPDHGAKEQARGANADAAD